jgi:hypothetical protein
VPTNAPAVGDLFDMFCFGDFGDDNSQGDNNNQGCNSQGGNSQGGNSQGNGNGQ